MKIVIFGLAVSSSWGNGHATLWRGLFKALAGRGHTVTFFEKDTPYYRTHRDATALEGCDLRIYDSWESARCAAREELSHADVGMVTSYCPDAVAATDQILESSCSAVFYDLDTPVTLLTLETTGSVPYIGNRGLRDFDLVFSFTGGSALDRLESQLGARKTVPLYGSVDPSVHAPVVVDRTVDLSYLGTYATDRQTSLDRLFLAAARQRPDLKFAIGGAQYPQDFPWTLNIFFSRHLAPAAHPSFFCSSRLTLNITRASMAALGYCPSGRLFEAASCGVPLITDEWEGLAEFYEPGREILPASSTEDVLEWLALPSDIKERIGRNARERTLEQHTAAHRAREMEEALEQFAFARVPRIETFN